MLLVRALGIGSVGLVGVNAELYNAIGQALKAKSLMSNTVLVGLANGSANSGYVPTDDAYGRYTFQVLGARTKPGCAETALPKAGDELLTKYAIGGFGGSKYCEADVPKILQLQTKTATNHSGIPVLLASHGLLVFTLLN